MNELALFSGAGGGILGGQLLGWRTVCSVERDEHCGSILVKRQNEGHLEPFPIWTDVETFDGRPWRGIVDVVSGGFPCQDISKAGRSGGIEGKKSGLWGEMSRIVGEVVPRFVFVENSPALTTRGMGHILGDLAAMGYDVGWGVLGAWDVGAPHRRDRMWVVATNASGRRYWAQEKEVQPRGHSALNGCGWEVEPSVGRMADGMARRVDRLKALGNGQVPSVAALAWLELSRRLRAT